MGENRYGPAVPESVSHHDLKKIAWEFARNKGNLVKLPKILGLSTSAGRSFSSGSRTEARLGSPTGGTRS